MLGTLTADAEDDTLAESLLDTFEGQDDVAVGGSAVVGFQLGSTISEDLARAELFAFPLLIVLSLIFFRGRAALMPLVVGITTVLGTFLVLTAVNAFYGMSIFALNLVIGLGPRPGDRLHAVPGDPLPRGARGPGTDRRRDRHHHAHRGPDRRVLRGHGRGRARSP